MTDVLTERAIRSAIILLGLATIIGLATASPAAAQADPQIPIAGPDEAEVGQIIDVTIEVPAGAAAFEAVIDYDRDALDFGGLYGDDATSLLTATTNADRVAIAGYRCADESCDSGLVAGVGTMTVRFAVTLPGQHRIGLTGALHGDPSATMVDGEDSSITVSVAGDGGPTLGQPGQASLGDRNPMATDAADLTGEGLVTGQDVTEVVLGWSEVRRRGAPCELGSDRLSAVDVDGSGCIDVADLIAVAGAARPVIGSSKSGEELDRADAEADALDDNIVDRDALDEALAAANVTPMVVNSTSDEWDANLNNGICNTPSGVCSLRAAILQANVNPGPDVIHFNIPGAGPHRINLGDRLPTISDSSGGLLIDGYTQPGASANTLDRLSNASIKVEVYGPGFNSDVSFVISSADNTIRGLSIYRAFWNVQLTGAGATGNRIVGNFIGTDPAASYQIPGARNQYQDQAGVEIGNSASFNHIGTPALADRNVISGNPYSGVRINHAGTRGNMVQNNLVGLHPNGNSSLYTYVAGIDVQWGAEETLVGGYQEHGGNVVTGNTNYGVDLSHSSKNNRVIGNYLGTNATGTAVATHTGNLIGLAIKDNTVGNLIEYNVIGGNRWDGIWHRHNFTGANTFRYNRIGVGVDDSNIGNARYGIFLSGHDDTYFGNVIANNGSNGFYVSNYNGGNGFSPPEYTQRNEITANSFFRNGGRAIDVVSAHNNISAPSITAISTGSVSGSACGGCRVELYVSEGGQGRQFIASTVASSSGAWGIADGAIANTTVVAMAISSNEDSSVFGNAASVGSPVNNQAPTIAPIPNQSGARYALVSVPVSAGDADGNYLTYSAIGLPAGVSIDQRTGVISGRPGSVGIHRVVVRVDDGARTAQQSFEWGVDQPNRPPTIEGPTAERAIDDFEQDSGWQINPAGTDSATVGQWEIGDLQQSAAQNGAVFQLGATPSGIGGLVTGRLAGNGTGSYDIDGGVTTALSPAIALSPAATALEYSSYFAYASNASNDDYFSTTVVDGNGARTGVALQRATPSNRAAEWTTTSIDVSAWAGQSIRIEFAAADAGSASLVEAAVDDLILIDNGQAGTVGDAVAVSVTGSDPDGDELDYSATGLPGGLSIDDDGQISGTLTQAGSFNVVVTVADPSGAEASVGFGWTVAPGAAPFSCAVSGSTLTWTDDNATIYYIRRQLNGTDTYLGATAQLQFPLNNPAGTYTVRHWTNGSPTDATCDA